MATAFSIDDTLGLDTASVDLLRRLKCCKCDDFFNTRDRVPRAQRCGHRICEHCLEVMITHSTDVDCPFCGVTTLLANSVRVEQLAVDEMTLAVARLLTPTRRAGDLGSIDVPLLLAKIRSLVDRAELIGSSCGNAAGGNGYMGAVDDSGFEDLFGSEDSSLVRGSSIDSMLLDYLSDCSNPPLPPPAPVPAPAPVSAPAPAPVAGDLEGTNPVSCPFIFVRDNDGQSGERHRVMVWWRRNGPWTSHSNRRAARVGERQRVDADMESLDRVLTEQRLIDQDYRPVFSFVRNERYMRRSSTEGANAPAGSTSGVTGSAEPTPGANSTAEPTSGVTSPVIPIAGPSSGTAESSGDVVVAAATTIPDTDSSIFRRMRQNRVTRFLSSIKLNPNRRRHKAGTAGDPAMEIDPVLTRFFTLVPKLTEEQKKIQCVVCLQDMKEPSFFNDERMTPLTVVSLECGHLHHHHCIANVFWRQTFTHAIKCPRCQRFFFHPAVAENAVERELARIRIMQAHPDPVDVNDYLPFMRDRSSNA